MEKSVHYRKLRDAFYNSEGVRLYNRTLSNQLSSYTFENNYIELHKLIELHSQLDTQLKLGDVHNREPRQHFLAEITRLLHNFLASAKSLVDHTRNFIRAAYSDQKEIVEEYQTEVNLRLSNSPVCKFTQDLRTFFTHINMPFIASVDHGPDASGVYLFTLKLNTDKMKYTKRWSLKAKEYIQRHGPAIDLGIYVEDYYQIIHGFSLWLTARNEIWSKDAWEKALLIKDEASKYEQDKRHLTGTVKARKPDKNNKK